MIKDSPGHRVFIVLARVHDEDLDPRKVPGGVHDGSGLDDLRPGADDEGDSHALT